MVTMAETPPFDAATLAAPGVQQLKPYQPGKPIEAVERELGLRDVAKLASNENPLGASPNALAAATAALAGVWLYPDGGAVELKQLLADHLHVQPEQLVLGNGSCEVLDMIARSFLSAGRSAVFSQYSFAMYPLIVRAAGAAAIVTPALDYGHDPVAMADAACEAAADGQPTVLFIANPNNPTGSWLGQDAIRTLLATVPQHVIVVLDEAYFEYGRDLNLPDGLDELAEHPNLIVLRTFSKAYGLAGLRIGYGVCHPAVAEVLNRARMPFNNNSAALAAAAAALADKDHLRSGVELNARGRAHLQTLAAQLGIDAPQSAANFVLFDFGQPALPLYQALLERGLITRPLGAELPNHLRISTGTAAQHDKLEAALGELLPAGRAA